MPIGAVNFLQNLIRVSLGSPLWKIRAKFLVFSCFLMVGIRRLSWGALLISGILSSGKEIALGRFEKTQLYKVLTELVQDPFEQVTQTA